MFFVLFSKAHPVKKIMQKYPGLQISAETNNFQLLYVRINMGRSRVVSVRYRVSQH